MKKLYYIRTNDYERLVIIDGENVKYLSENEWDIFPNGKDFIFNGKNDTYQNAINEFLKNEVENGTSWENDISFEEMVKIMDKSEIVAQIGEVI